MRDNSWLARIDTHAHVIRVADHPAIVLRIMYVLYLTIYVLYVHTHNIFIGAHSALNFWHRMIVSQLVSIL